MAQRRIIQAIFDNDQLLKAARAEAATSETPCGHEAKVAEVQVRSEQFRNAAKQELVAPGATLSADDPIRRFIEPTGRPLMMHQSRKNVFRRMWASFKSWRLSPTTGWLQKLSCRKTKRNVGNSVEVIYGVVNQPIINDGNIDVADTDNDANIIDNTNTEVEDVNAEIIQNVGPAEKDAVVVDADITDQSDCDETDSLPDDGADAEIESVMSSPQQSSEIDEIREVRSRQHRHSERVLRTLPNVVRGNQCVSWQLDHRPLFIAPIRSKSPRPKLSSDRTHPKNPAKVLHDLVLVQQHAERVRQEQEALRRGVSQIVNERVDEYANVTT